ncbi:fatty acid desaturase family protein [Qipengyuania aquimaris]|uniref:fatty acid desaturase family protein n=1 Tax=Qipengyuania aquimaris TaxID=255984 RepID=UPI001FD46CCD|nr:fatty acid desaturase [Qipengyuania aquimaris]UOR15698.1 fatty acid desaturase [Qipengyuania aquimaris]
MKLDQTLSAANPAQLREKRGWHSQIADDKAMLRAARDLTKDIAEHRASIYWSDMIASALIGYGSLAGAILVENTALAIVLAVVSVLSLYRALLFIHEISHFRNGALPGFRTAWNALVGVPMLTPSFMYEQVHTLHHKRTQYGTVEDPEYLPLALMNAWSLPLFVIIAILAPVALLVRFAVLVPLGAIIPPIRQLTWQRASALAINPEFRRRPPEGELRPRVLMQEAAGFIWSWVLIGSVFAFGWKPLLVALGVASAVALLNQLRTLVAHLWENEGEAMTVTAQFLDSVNVPPPGRIAEIWAPVGLRYHALHHLMPSMPYHSLPEAHRRLVKELGESSTYHGANHAGMGVLVARIARSTMGRRS